MVSKATLVRDAMGGGGVELSQELGASKASSRLPRPMHNQSMRLQPRASKTTDPLARRPSLGCCETSRASAAGHRDAASAQLAFLAALQHERRSSRRRRCHTCGVGAVRDIPGAIANHRLGAMSALGGTTRHTSQLCAAAAHEEAARCMMT